MNAGAAAQDRKAHVWKLTPARERCGTSSTRPASRASPDRHARTGASLPVCRPRGAGRTRGRNTRTNRVTNPNRSRRHVMVTTILRRNGFCTSANLRKAKPGSRCTVQKPQLKRRERRGIAEEPRSEYRGALNMSLVHLRKRSTHSHQLPPRSSSASFASSGFLCVKKPARHQPTRRHIRSRPSRRNTSVIQPAPPRQSPIPPTARRG